MSQWTLAGVATAVAAAVFVVLGFLWWLRDRVDRRAGAAVDVAAIDPYYAVVRGNAWYRADGDVNEAVAAALLGAGLIEISPEGLVTATAARDVPAHPVEAAALEFLRGHDGPAGLKELTWDADQRRRREEFRREQDARYPGLARDENDVLQLAAYGTAVLLAAFFAVQVTFLRDGGPTGLGDLVGRSLVLLLLGLVFTLLLVLFTGISWPVRRDPLHDLCAGLLPHPAVRALDPRQRELLRAGTAYRFPFEIEHEERERNRYTSDTDGAF
ncbi:hypothetical protein QEZ54_27415 [Catellatospora sp. KI3]|uniref:hypothetical protein n=1 Tax=Catellatospora sp. KI3 TaxID=3041620 RepID=UPI0024826F54|nr:hypothetical protein [Catellatospora sp. KI3]MDI1464706.1 hypothetical protein [Catellatospora sp. KI3]